MNERAYRCLLCFDSGITLCFNAKWLDHHRGEIESGVEPYTLHRDAFKWCRAIGEPFRYAMACKCHTGERRVNVAQRGRFDPASHVHDTGDFNADCLRWLESHAAAQPVGYYAEFV